CYEASGRKGHNTGSLIRRSQVHDWGTVMQVHGKKIRRVISILCALAVAGTLAATLTSASAATPRATATTAAFALRGSIAGGINTALPDQMLTCVFSEINYTSASVPKALELSNVITDQIAA